MNSSRARRSPIAALVIGLFLSAGCAHQPAFQSMLPSDIDRDGKAIAIIGDTQQTPGFIRFTRRRENNLLDQRRLFDDLDAIVDELSSLVVVGDLVYSARSSRDWAHFDSLVAPLAASIPVLPAIGNHDYPCIFIEICFKSRISKGMLERFPWIVPGQPYAVESDDWLMLFLDSETGFEQQGEWLQERLDNAPGRFAAALVFFHRPAFTNSIVFGAVSDPDVQQHFVPRLEQANLPVVAFSGHVHGFEHLVVSNIHYVTTAGGGGARGPLAAERPFDRYRGPDCPQPKGGIVLRPFNYVLVREIDNRLTIDIRGFCRGDDGVRSLDTIEIPLAAIND